MMSVVEVPVIAETVSLYRCTAQHSTTTASTASATTSVGGELS